MITSISRLRREGYREVRPSVSASKDRISPMRARLHTQRIAIIRLEQLYPVFKREVLEITKKYSAAREIVWVQEEPENMGAWSFISQAYKMIPWKLISRDEGPTPATGYYQQHLVEQKDIIDRAFTRVKNNVKKKAVASLT